MEFSEACSEVDYILEHLNPIDKAKIPKKVFEFFKDNKSIFYNVELTPTKTLEEQKLKKETKAFLQILGYKYFFNEKQKKKFEEIYEKENLKDFMEERYESQPKIENSEVTELTIYKQNKIITWLRKILGLFKNLK